MANLASQFASLLNKPAAEVQKPKPLPAGGYIGVIKAYTFGESRQKKTPFIQIQIQPTGPGNDVDLGQLEMAGGLAALTKRTLKCRGTEFYLSEDAQFRLKDLMENVCGIDLNGRTMGDGVPEMVNKTLGFNIKHVPSEDGSEIFMEVDSYFRAE